MTKSTTTLKVEEPPYMRIILIGNTGDGKSSLGNLLFNEEIFEARLSAGTAVTNETIEVSGYFRKD